MSVVISNPQLLDSAGRSTNKIWIPGVYSFRVDNTNDVQQLIDLDAGGVTSTGTTVVSNIQGTNTIVGTAASTITSYIDKELYTWTVATTNTGPVTLNIDGVGANPVVFASDIPVESGDLVVGKNVIVQRNNTNANFVILNREIATQAEAVAGTNNTNGMTPLRVTQAFTPQLPTTATTTTEGIVELATDAEVVTGTDTSRVAPVSALGSHQGVAKVGVNFNGTGTVAIRESFNVSSIIDQSVGNYQINFTNNMANTDYIPVGMAQLDNTAPSDVNSHVALRRQSNTFTVSSLRVVTGPPATGGVSDHVVVSVAIFGELA